MAFTVQDDNGSVAGANAYISVDELKAYHADRGNDLSGKTDPDLEKAIVRATDYLDHRFNFVGKRLTLDQPTQWPRSSAYDRDRYIVNGVPKAVKEATAEYALRALTLAALNPDPTADETGRAVQAKSSEVGSIKESVTYAQGAVFQLPRYPAADQRLRKTGLTRSGGDLLRA